MDFESMKNALESVTGFTDKVAYWCFPEGEAPQLPFICYFSPNTENFCADGKVFYTAPNFTVELYAHKRDLASEKLIEDKFAEKNWYWEKETTYLDDEKVFMTIYTL